MRKLVRMLWAIVALLLIAIFMMAAQAGTFA